jgi:hypothetical protein
MKFTNIYKLITTYFLYNALINYFLINNFDFNQTFIYILLHYVKFKFNHDNHQFCVIH